jgi:hypothetical protein
MAMMAITTNSSIKVKPFYQGIFPSFGKSWFTRRSGLKAKMGPKCQLCLRLVDRFGTSEEGFPRVSAIRKMESSSGEALRETSGHAVGIRGPFR